MDAVSSTTSSRTWLQSNGNAANGNAANGVQKVKETEEWVGMVGLDAFPGEDAAKLPDNVAEAKRECLARGCGGFVCWRGAIFLRPRGTVELLKAAAPHLGATLWLPSKPIEAVSALSHSVPLREGGRFALPAAVPEVHFPGAKAVEKRAGLTIDEMNKRFEKSLPVVITDAQVGWPAREKWTWDWFAEQYGEIEMPCSDLAPFFRHCDRGKILTLQVSMAEFVRYVQGELNAVAALQRYPDRPFYANGWAPFFDHEELLKDISDRLYCVQDVIPRGEGPMNQFNASLTKIFLGPAGTVSRLHCDTYATHVWLSQIRGRKQFIVFPPEDTEHLGHVPDEECDGRTSLFDPERPNFNAYPAARKARAYSVVVEEGETVVLPSRWWHWAKSLTPSVTLMRNFVNEVNFQEHCRIRNQAAEVRNSRLKAAAC